MQNGKLYLTTAPADLPDLVSQCDITVVSDISQEEWNTAVNKTRAEDGWKGVDVSVDFSEFGLELHPEITPKPCFNFVVDKLGEFKITASFAMQLSLEVKESLTLQAAISTSISKNASLYFSN